jgi:hypothetical protein
MVGNYGNSALLHARLGYGVIVMVTLTTFIGWCVVNINHPVINNLSGTIRLYHRMFGFGAYLMGVVTGYFGVVDISAGKEYSHSMPIAYISTVGIMPLILILYGEYHLYQKKELSRSQTGTAPEDFYSNGEKLPRFMWEDINQRVTLGAKWLVIHGIICKWISLLGSETESDRIDL